jgi:hypothetical protein
MRNRTTKPLFSREKLHQGTSSLMYVVSPVEEAKKFLLTLHLLSVERKNFWSKIDLLKKDK